MSDQPARQYAEDGKIIGECECGRYTIAPRFHVAPYWFDEIGGASEGGFVCSGYPGKPCGSLCRADGTATPGALVLWEALHVLQEDVRTSCISVTINRRAVEPDQPEVTCPTLAETLAQARATLAAREGVAR